MMRLSLFVIVLLSLFFVACKYTVVPIAVSHVFTGEYTGIDHKLNVDGYYLGKEMNKKTKETKYYGLLLYRDGSVAYEPRIIYKSEQDFVSDFVNNPESKQFNEHWKGWGYYKLVGDTLELVSTQRYRGAKIETERSKFLILSRNSLQLLEGKYKDEGREMLQYTPYANRIDSAHWMKEQSWFVK